MVFTRFRLQCRQAKQTIFLFIEHLEFMNGSSGHRIMNSIFLVANIIEITVTRRLNFASVRYQRSIWSYSQFNCKKWEEREILSSAYKVIKKRRYERLFSIRWPNIAKQNSIKLVQSWYLVLSRLQWLLCSSDLPSTTAVTSSCCQLQLQG